MPWHWMRPRKLSRFNARTASLTLMAADADQLGEQQAAERPGTETGGGVDMPRRADIDEAAAPALREGGGTVSRD